MKPTPLLLALAALLAAGPAVAQMREYPVRTPVPANAIPPGMGPREGTVALLDNMPGHRNFKPPLFPDSGWDSPLRADGEKDYDRYLVEYWRAPYLPPNDVFEGYPGQEQPGYVAPGPHAARIARSRATEAEDALFERRMQFITEQVLASVPLRNLHGASVEPELTIAGYGEAFGATGDGVMRGQIQLELDVIAPHAGVTERMPNGTIKSSYSGPTLTIELNPELIDCAGPVEQSAAGARCLLTDGRVWLNTARPALDASGGGDNEPRLQLSQGVYADGRPSTDLRAVFVRHNRRGRQRGNIHRGLMHPHDPLGRVIAAMELIDWNDLLTRAAALE